MNDRKRLTELVLNTLLITEPEKGYVHIANRVADRLLADGLVVQKQGKWNMKGTAYGCSVCGNGAFHPWSNYCPNCGAKMEVNDGSDS